MRAWPSSLRRSFGAAALLGALGGVLVVATPQAASAAATPLTLDAELAAALDEVGLLAEFYESATVEPELALVVATNTATEARAAFLASVAARSQAVSDLTQTRGQITVTERYLDGLTIAIAGRSADLTTASVRRETVALARRTTVARLEQVTSALKAAAIADYIGGQDPELALTGSTTAYNEVAGQQELLETATADLFDQREGLFDALADLDVELDLTVANIASLVEELVVLGEGKDQAEEVLAQAFRTVLTLEAVIAGLDTQLPTMLDALHEEHRFGMLPEVGLSLVVVDGYLRGARTAREVRPGCAIGWPVLAGIAAVESGHGTFRGSSVDADGQVSPPILGPVLNGELVDTAVIEDTDGGALDGDTSFDRAVGPFQFIPGTWTAFALDANDDERADPQNLYDAAATAGNYLCAISPMGADAEIRRGIYGYNHSGAYVRSVLTQANRFWGVVFPPIPELELDADSQGPSP